MTGSARTVDGLQESLDRSLTAERSRDWPVTVVGPKGRDRRSCPPRHVAQPFVVLSGVRFPDLEGIYGGSFETGDACAHRVPGALSPTLHGPYCTRPAGHGGRHHAADGVHVWAVWGVRA